MQYIMVTDWDKHWDQIPGNFTSYTMKMLKKGMTKEKLISGTETIFIKKSQSGETVEKVWKGTTNDFAAVPGGIFFRVGIDKEIDCPDEYATFKNGWYLEE